MTDRHLVDLQPGWVEIMFIPKGCYAVQGDDRGWHVFRNDAVIERREDTPDPLLYDGCRHTEHAVRAGVGRVGRYFESMNDQTGTWEPCPDGYHPAGAWDDIPATVCVVHLRFVPCRRDEPESRCHISTDPKQVTVVRDYQMSKLSESFAHAALDRLQQFDGGRDEL